jgi:hypothetical protein
MIYICTDKSKKIGWLVVKECEEKGGRGARELQYHTLLPLPHMRHHPTGRSLSDRKGKVSRLPHYFSHNITLSLLNHIISKIQ